MRTGAKSTLGQKPRDMKLKVSTKIKGNQGQLDTCLGRDWQWSISTNWKVRVPHTKNEIKQSKRQGRTGFAHLTSAIDGAGSRGNKNNIKIHNHPV